MAIVYREVKGSPLTYQEGDGNFQYLDNKKYVSTVDPDVTDDDSKGFYAGAGWFNTTTGKTFICTDAATGNANWELEQGGAFVAKPPAPDESIYGYSSIGYIDNDDAGVSGTPPGENTLNSSIYMSAVDSWAYYGITGDGGTDNQPAVTTQPGSVADESIIWGRGIVVPDDGIINSFLLINNSGYQNKVPYDDQTGGGEA